MKFYLSLLASLCLASTPFIAPVIALEAKIVALASAINPYIKENIAPKITVRIDSAENGGSGVIIAKQDNTYLILTNAHVLREDNSFTVYTHDGETHQAQEIANSIETEDDLALLEFTSNNAYETATINSAAKPQVDQSVLVVGYSAETGELVTQEEVIRKVPDKTLKDGYQIGYSGDVVQGMSGGAILNTDGEVIGINGKSAFPILDTGYVYQDGTEISTEEVEQLRQLSWGLSINRLLTQVNQDLITAYNLPLPETTGEIKTVHTGWIGDLETKAKQITVRIDSTSGGNGSGVIIAKEGNTYTVLTADHVLCEKDEKTRECIGYDYTIITPDGKSQTLDPQTIKAQPGVDLAVFQFTSPETYQVAELADYPLQDDDAIFVAGYPQLGKNTPPEWRFSLGDGLEKERGLLSLNVSSNASNQENSESLSSQSSLTGGYEMVYTSPTYGGMSGGAVLDKQGRVIGIHGQAEGEAIIDNQSGNKNKIQLGYSLGIPIKTFIGLQTKLGIEERLTVAENSTAGLNLSEKQAFEAAILGTEISQTNATAQRWLERGNQLWRLRRYEDAEAAFNRVLELNESELDYLAHYGKGLALRDQGKLDLALASMESATRSNPEFAAAFYYKNRVLYSLDRFDEALIAINQAIFLEENNPNYYLFKATILSDVKRFDEALTAYNRAIEISPRSVSFGDRGVLYFKQGKADLALDDFNQAIEINPQYANAYDNRGNLYDEQGKADLALDDYNQAIEINPQYANAYYNRGNLYKSLGKADLALDDFNQAIEINPQYANAYGNRGILYDEQGKADLALDDYKQAIEINPQYANAYANRGSLYFRQGKADLALDDFNQAIEINPQYANAYGNRGLLYFRQGKADLALDDFNQVIQINPQDAIAYANRGSLYFKQGKAELALADLKKAQQLFIAQNNTEGTKEIANLLKQFQNQEKPELTNSNSNQTQEQEPQSAEEYYNRGLAYHKQSEDDLAIADYTKAIELDPNNEKALINRGLLYAKQDKNDLALADYNQAIEVNPNHSGSYRNRGVLYFEQGEYKLAEADWNKAIEVNPEDAQAYYNRGLLFKKLGDETSEKADLEKAHQLSSTQNNTILTQKIVRILPKVVEEERIRSDLAKYNQAIQRNHSDIEAYFDRGDFYYEQGKLELAISDFKKVIQLNPNHSAAHINLGYVYRQIGNTEAAKFHFQKAEKLFAAQGKSELAQNVANILNQLP